MTMTHPGLPLGWCIAVILLMLVLTIRTLLSFKRSAISSSDHIISFTKIPVIGSISKFLTASPLPLLMLKIVMVIFFLIVIAAGLFGTPIAERNLATVLTWNIWWAGLIVSVFFLGSAWCAICPWDALATWLVRRRLWKRADPNNSLNLKVPRWLRSVWPALILLIGLTWLELGVGVTSNPYVTSLLALLMVVMATISLAIYEGKAFCRYFCPVGRTIGFYSQLAPVELRPINTDICASCTTLECYHGSDSAEPCPTHLVMGRLKQNTYCTSCGNCTQSCPDHNVAWHLRPPSQEAIQNARPHWDEAWFILFLLALTMFHGVSMMPFFEQWLSQFAVLLNDSGQLLISFTVLLSISLALPIMIFFIFSMLIRIMNGNVLSIKKIVPVFAFVALPLAFAYHLAHNLNHLIREGSGLSALITNPFGRDTQPLSMMEKHMRHMDMLIPQDLLFAIQAGLIVFGYWISLRVIEHRGRIMIPDVSWKLSPMIGFAILVSLFHLTLLSQSMVMRF